MIDTQRLRQALEDKGLSQAALARLVGISQQSIAKLLAGQAYSSRYLYRIARELGTSVEYLSGESDDPRPGAQPAPIDEDEEDDDSVEIDSVDLAYGLGGTYLDAHDGSVDVEKLRFSRTWLRKFTPASPDFLYVAEGHGDSMSPTIEDNDIVIVDRSQRDVRMGDKIWAVSFGGIGMIKRLRPLPNGTMRIISSNATVPDELATDGELFIHGRVVAVVRKV